ncbi:MAG: hypothetical protein RL594_49 [Bacteroidota bacterium]|jgi:hypothetical protein
MTLYHVLKVCAVAAVITSVAVSAQGLPQLVDNATPQAVQRVFGEHPRLLALAVQHPNGRRIHTKLERVAWTSPWAKNVVVTDGAEHVSPLAQDVVLYRTLPGPAGSDWTIIALDRRGAVMGLTQQSGHRATIVRDTSNSLQLRFAPTSSASRGCKTDPEKISDAAHQALRQAGSKTIEATAANDTLTLQLAVEVDNDAVRAAGGVDDARLWIAVNLAAVAMVYETELRTKVLITNLRLWDVPNDPYPTQQDVFSLLDTFVDVYQTTMKTVERDAALFITSRETAGGIAATIGGLCDEDGSYCAVDIDTEATAFPQWSWNVSVISHELGHLCGGIHTHSCYWPGGALDSCVTAESGTCFSGDDVKPSRGTIMSYCAATGDPASNDVLEFHPMHRLVLREYLQNRPCVGGQSATRASAITGTIRDAETQQPLSGVTLKIRAVNDEIYRGTPQPAGDTIVSTAADGAWTFTGLGRGLYSIDIDGPYTIYPAQVGEDAFSLGVAVADTLERKDIWVTKGQIVDVIVHNGGDTTATILNIFSDRLPGVLAVVPMPFPEQGQTSVRVRRVLPLGRTIIVPSAVGRRFEPTTVRLDLSGDGAQQSASLNSVSVLPKLTSTIAFATTTYARSSMPQQRRSPNIRYEVSEYGSSTVFKGETDADGIAVIEDVRASSSFDVVPQIDTQIYAPASAPGYLLPMYDETATVVTVQERRRPLLARQYRFRSEQGTYRPLDNPTIVRDLSQFGRIVTPVALPFTVGILDRTLDTMFIHTNGFVSFGARPLPAWARAPLSMWNDADVIIAPFAFDMTLDTNAPNGARICWTVEGTAPDRSIVVEWRGMTLLSYDYYQGGVVNLGRLSMQVRLYERGDISMSYDTEIPIPEPVDVVVGLRGHDVLDNQVVRSATNGSILEARAAFDNLGTVRLRVTPSRQFEKGTTFWWELGTTSVSSTDGNVSAMPQLVHEALHLDTIRPGTLVQLLSMQGQTMRNIEATGTDVRVDVSDLPSGLYQLVLRSEHHVQHCPVIIVR